MDEINQDTARSKMLGFCLVCKNDCAKNAHFCPTCGNRFVAEAKSGLGFWTIAFGVAVGNILFGLIGLIVLALFGGFLIT